MVLILCSIDYSPGKVKIYEMLQRRIHCVTDWCSSSASDIWIQIIDRWNCKYLHKRLEYNKICGNMRDRTILFSCHQKIISHHNQHWNPPKTVPFHCILSWTLFWTWFIVPFLESNFDEAAWPIEVIAFPDSLSNENLPSYHWSNKSLCNKEIFCVILPPNLPFLVAKVWGQVCFNYFVNAQTLLSKTDFTSVNQLHCWCTLCSEDVQVV